MNKEASSGKLKSTLHGGGSSAAKYFSLTYGPMPRWKAILMEVTTTLFCGVPGALGLLLRSKLYRPFFGACGRGVVIGRNVTFRHPSKIRLGAGVVLDDNCVVDAKGGAGSGISLGKNVYIGRNTIVYCKGGEIEIDDDVNFSSNCIVFSSNKLSMKPGTMVGAYSYLLSGGEYDYKTGVPFTAQAGMETVGPLEIGAGCWFGARVTVLDGACIGDRCVLGAGAVVTRPLPANSLAVGVPAKMVGTVPVESLEEVASC